MTINNNSNTNRNVDVNNDTLASAMRTIINDRLTIDTHTPTNNNVNATQNDDFEPTHVIVSGFGVTISEFLDPDEYTNNAIYGETLVRMVAAYNSADKVLTGT
jgi:tRNA A22 N-methylase